MLEVDTALESLPSNLEHIELCSCYTESFSLAVIEGKPYIH